MMWMIIPLRGALIEQAAELWEKFFDRKYAVPAWLIQQKVEHCPVNDPENTLAVVREDKVQAFIILNSSPAPSLFHGPDPDVAHIAALCFKHADDAVDLLSRVKRNLKSQGVLHLMYGSGVCHFFPGVPEDCGPLRDLLSVEGFHHRDPVHDVERDLHDYVEPIAITEKRREPEAANFSTRRIGDADVTGLIQFLRREFPGRWQHDMTQMLALQPDPRFLFGFFMEEELVGFCMVQDASSKAFINGSVWQASLGDRWCALGPIGLSEKLRGQGRGGVFLADILNQLRDEGFRRCLVDWTVRLRYFGDHGFTVTRTYVPRMLTLVNVVDREEASSDSA